MESSISQIPVEFYSYVLYPGYAVGFDINLKLYSLNEIVATFGMGVYICWFDVRCRRWVRRICGSSAVAGWDNVGAP